MKKLMKFILAMLLLTASVQTAMANGTGQRDASEVDCDEIDNGNGAGTEVTGGAAAEAGEDGAIQN